MELVNFFLFSKDLVTIETSYDRQKNDAIFGRSSKLFFFAHIWDTHYPKLKNLDKSAQNNAINC